MQNNLSMQKVVDDYMSTQPLTVHAEIRLMAAEELMRSRKIRCLIVVDVKAKPIGLIELFDV